MGLHERGALPRGEAGVDGSGAASGKGLGFSSQVRRRVGPLMPEAKAKEYHSRNSAPSVGEAGKAYRGFRAGGR